MKLSILRSIAVLAVVLGVAGCGSKAKFEVKGTMVNEDTGLIGGPLYSGLQLENNGEVIDVPVGATTFKFTKEIEYGQAYNVTLKRDADHQDCRMLSSGDTAGRLLTIDVNVGCKLEVHAVEVKVNKAAPGLVLTNGSGQTVALGDTGTVATFGVQYGKSYGITVLEQPKAGGVCTVQNGSGTMGDIDIKEVVKVTCP